MKENPEKFTNQKELHKKAVEEIETILVNIEGQNSDAAVFIREVLEKLLNGELVPKEALRRAKDVETSLKFSKDLPR